MTNPHPLTEVEVTPEDYEIAERANVLWGRAINGPHVAVLAAAMGRLSTSAQPSTEAVKLAAFDLMQEFYVSRYYEPKPERPADNIQAAIEFVLDRQSPPLPSIDEARKQALEEAAKAIEEQASSIVAQAGSSTHYALVYAVEVIRDLMRVDAPKGLDDG